MKTWLGQPRQSRPHPVGTTPRQRGRAEDARDKELVARTKGTSPQPSTSPHTTYHRDMKTAGFRSAEIPADEWATMLFGRRNEAVDQSVEYAER